MGFYIFLMAGLKKNQKKNDFDLGKFYEIQVSVNRIWLEHAHGHLFTGYWQNEVAIRPVGGGGSCKA